MAVEILMPELGESVHEGTVTRWLKQVGDTVKEDEPVVEIMTDKVNTELQAPAAGVLTKILVNEGENVQVFQALGIIGGEGEAVAQEETKPPPTSEPMPPKEAETVTTGIPKSNDEPKKWYTPVVRSIAKEAGVSDDELASIHGSGEGGRVTKRDLEDYLQRRGLRVSSDTLIPPSKTQYVPTEEASVKKSFEAPKVVRDYSQEVVNEPTIDSTKDVVPLTGMRKVIADHMTKAQLIPSVSTMVQVDVSKIVEFRKANKDSFQQMYSVRLTYTPFFIKAASEALVEFPTVNNLITNDSNLVVNKNVNIGIAVALGDGSQGLVVPVIRDCQKKTLIEIARDLDSIANKARNNQLELSELQGATFSLTNPGSYGALMGTPMIPPGQSAILGTYSILDTPVVVGGNIGIRPMMYLVLSYDHRLIDGMLAGRFLQSIKTKLETFDFFR